MCGNYKLADQVNGQSTSAYICETCFMDTYGAYTLQGPSQYGSAFRNLQKRQLSKSVLKRHSVAQIFIEKMNHRAQEVEATWRTYLDQRSDDSIVDYSRLYESEDKSDLRKAIRRLEEDKR